MCSGCSDAIADALDYYAKLNSTDEGVMYYQQ